MRGQTQFILGAFIGGALGGAALYYLIGLILRLG